MSAILFLSLAVRLLALGWSIVIWRRVKDWRLAALTLVLGLMTVRQGMTLAAASENWPAALAEISDDISSLLVGIGALLAVILVGRIVTDKNRAAADMAAANTKLRQEMNSRNETERRLRESERMLSTLMRNLPGMVYRCRNDRDWTVEFCSEGCRELTGYEPEDLIQNRNVSYASLIRPEDAEAVWEDVQTAVRESRPFRITYRIRTASGEEKWVWEQGCAVPTTDGVPYLEGFITDITEQRLVEDQLRQSQKMEVVGQLTGGVAHDFNNLLAVIVGNLELANDLVPDGSRESEQIGRALTAAERGATLTRQLLAFSRKQFLRPQVLDINKHLPRMAGMIHQLLGESFEVETVLGGGLWKTTVDPGQLEHALLNLAVNARDALPQGGRITIETGNVRLDDEYRKVNPYAAAGRYVMLAVTDNGSGMAPDVAARAFEPFFTTKDVGKGSGLGLSMVYGFVKQSGGHIKIYSEVDRGTTVKMYFPRATSQIETEPDRPHQEAAGGSGKTILVVEDDPEVRRLSIETLSSLGYRVLGAHDGPAALEILGKNQDVHLLFTDLVLPGGMDGVTVASEAQKLLPGLKVLFTTGYSHNAAVRENGFGDDTEVLAKPYRKADLARKISQVLEGGGEGSG